jgi:hypothetical protein
MLTSAVEKSVLKLPMVSVLIPSLYCQTYCNMTKIMNHGRAIEAPSGKQQLVKTCFLAMNICITARSNIF